MATTASTTTTTLNSTLYACGSEARFDVVEEEDPSLSATQIGIFAACVLTLWVVFAVWHSVTACAYWKRMPARHLYEARFQTCCRSLGQVAKEDDETRLLQRRNGAIGLLVWRAVNFLWIGCFAWYMEVNLYYFTNLTLTCTWIYFAFATLTSLRGLLGLMGKPSNCFVRKEGDAADGLDIIHGLFYENMAMSILYVDIVFWTVLASSTTPVNAFNLIAHGPINAIVIVVEVIISAVPSCWANMITSALTLQVYAIFHFIYYHTGWGCYPYAFFDTNADFYGSRTAWAPIWIAILFAALISCHLLMYGVDAAANACFKTCYQRNVVKAHCCVARHQHEEKVDDAGDVEMATTTEYEQKKVGATAGGAGSKTEAF